MVVKASQRRGFARLSGGRVTGALYVTFPMRFSQPAQRNGHLAPALGQVASQTRPERVGSPRRTWVYVEGCRRARTNLKVEADKVRSVNRYMEQKAWGAFRYHVFPSYDFVPIAADLKKQHA